MDKKEHTFKIIASNKELDRFKDALIRARELLKGMDNYEAELDAAELLRLLNIISRERSYN